VCVSRHNTKCPGCGASPDLRTLWVNALTLEFEGLQAHGYSPQQIISKILTGVRPDLILFAHSGGSCWAKPILVPLLNLLALESPVQLPQWRNFLRQGRPLGSQLVVVVVVVSMLWLTIPLHSVVTHSPGGYTSGSSMGPFSWCCSLCLSLHLSLFGRRNTVLLSSFLG